MEDKHSSTGSMSASGAQKNKQTTIRRIKGYRPWFEPNSELSTARQRFDSGFMTDVVFNPTATVMKDVFCGTDRVSEATATGVLESIGEREMPADAKVVRNVDYNTKKKIFHTRGDTGETFFRCDYLILRNDGTSLAGWKSDTIPAS